MKKTPTVFTKRFLIGTALTLGALLTLAGCITAATIATIGYIKSQSEHTAVVHLDPTPDEVFRAMQRIVADRPDLTIKKEDPQKYTMHVNKDNNTAKATAKRLDTGKTELKVTASAKEEQVTHEQLALRVVERVCTELGVKYKVVENQGLFK